MLRRIMSFVDRIGDCAWTSDEDGLWYTPCNNIFVFIAGDPAENKFRFCPYCGRSLTFTPYQEPDDHP